MKLKKVLNKLIIFGSEIHSSVDEYIDDKDFNEYSCDLTESVHLTRSSEIEYLDVLNAEVQVIRTSEDDFIFITDDLFESDSISCDIDYILENYIIEGIEVDADPILLRQFIQVLKGYEMNIFNLNKYLITKDITRVLVFSGPSGCGKNFLEGKILRHYPELFNKLPQISTREMRPGEVQGNPYIFISENTFEKLKDNLVGRVGINSNLFRSKYGSMADFRNDKINTLILSDEGLSDFLSIYKDKKDFRIFILGLDKHIDLPERKDRDEAMREEERKVLLRCNYVWNYEDHNFEFMSEYALLLLLYRNDFLSLDELTDSTMMKIIRTMDDNYDEYL